MSSVSRVYIFLFSVQIVTMVDEKGYTGAALTSAPSIPSSYWQSRYNLQNIHLENHVNYVWFALNVFCWISLCNWIVQHKYCFTDCMTIGLPSWLHICTIYICIYFSVSPPLPPPPSEKSIRYKSWKPFENLFLTWT